MAELIQFRRGSQTYMAGEGSQIVLQVGEPFLEYPDTGIGTPGSKLKVGDGTSKYCDLPYISSYSSGGSYASDQKLVKARYLIENSGWSYDDSLGYYVYNLSLTTPLNTTYAPNISLASANDDTVPNESQLSNYSKVVFTKLTSTTNLTLYSVTEVTGSFYAYVEGIESITFTEEQFITLLESGTFDKFYVGSKVVLNNPIWKDTNNTTWIIADVNHDYTQPNSYDLILENCLVRGVLDPDDENPSWRNSEIRTRLNDEYYNGFSNEIKSHMQYIRYIYEGEEYTDDHITIPSATELGATDMGEICLVEGNPYPIFTVSPYRNANNSRVKYYGDGTEITHGVQSWWTRSKQHLTTSVIDNNWFHVTINGSILAYGSWQNDFVVPVIRLH